LKAVIAYVKSFSLRFSKETAKPIKLGGTLLCA
jgi:hypothetical protein